MVRRRRGADAEVEDDQPPAKRPRNRASPYALVKLYPDLVPSQKAAFALLELDSMLDIKCDSLHTPVINWLGPLYDKHTREFVIPGRGRIPLNELAVFRTLGLPLGTVPVPYYIDKDLQATLGPHLFPRDGITPVATRVYEILKDMKKDSVEFRQICVMYMVSTVLNTTTSNLISNRCYPIVVSFASF